MGWKAGEREFLIYLTLNGPSDQKTVADTYRFATPTINLAKDGLVERGYITLRGREIRGRGAPRKIYGLTPAGLIAAVHEGDLWGNLRWLMEHWGDMAPVFIRRYETLWEWGFGGDAKRYCEVSLVENKIAIEALGKEGELVELRVVPPVQTEVDDRELQPSADQEAPDVQVRVLNLAFSLAAEAVVSSLSAELEEGNQREVAGRGQSPTRVGRVSEFAGREHEFSAGAYVELSGSWLRNRDEREGNDQAEH